MNLKQLVQQQTGTAAEIAAVLNTASVQRTFNTPVGPALLYKMAGLQVAGGVSAVLSAAASQSAFMADVQRTYCAYGLVLSDSDTRAQIDLIFTGDYAALGTALKNIGIYQVSPCIANSLPAATEESVQAVIDEIAEENAAGFHSQLVAEIINECFATNRFASMAELKAAVAAYGE